MKCDEVCRQTYEHVPLSGSWSGRNLTSWAEDYPPALARLLCDGMNIERVAHEFANPFHDSSVDADLSFQLENMFDAIAPGTYTSDDLNTIERNEVELFTGIQIREIHVLSFSTTAPSPTATCSRRSSFVRIRGRWHELEGSVLLRNSHERLNMRSGCDKGIFIFGGVLMRLRAATIPADANDRAVQHWLERFHVGCAHASPSEMAQAIKDGGGSRHLIRMALQFVCAQRDAEMNPRGRHRASLPLQARFFGAVVILDIVDILLERLGADPVKIHILVVIDSYSSWAMARILEEFTTAACLEAVLAWFSIFGGPRAVYHDNALNFTSAGWTDFMSRWGVLVTTTAAQAPWQHGRIDSFIRRLRRKIRACWKSFSRWPEATPAEVIWYAVTCGNELTRTAAGVSPNILVTGAQPKWFLGGSLEENFDLTIASSDPHGALQENIRKRSQARASWIRSETLHRMDRAVLSRPGRARLFHPGQLVQFYREQTHQGGRRGSLEGSGRCHRARVDFGFHRAAHRLRCLRRTALRISALPRVSVLLMSTLSWPAVPIKNITNFGPRCSVVAFRRVQTSAARAMDFPQDRTSQMCPKSSLRRRILRLAGAPITRRVLRCRIPDRQSTSSPKCFLRLGLVCPSRVYVPL